MSRRDQRRKPTLRIDLSDLDVHSVLLEDLRHYVGSPRDYVPKIWTLCMQVLREENRIILNSQDNSDALDAVWNQLFDEFSENKFRRIVRDKRLSVRMDGYRDNVTNFLYDVFEVMYPQVASYIDGLARSKQDISYTNYTAEVVRVDYDNSYDGFDTIDKEIGVKVEVTTENFITKNVLREKGYGF